MDFCKHKEKDCTEKKIAIFSHKKGVKNQAKMCNNPTKMLENFQSHSNRLGSRDSKITHGKIWILKPISNGWFWTKMTTFDLVSVHSPENIAHWDNQSGNCPILTAP